MICPKCKKQIPDNSDICPVCQNKINHKEQVPKEIKQRRWQRWFFYGVIALMFLIFIGVIIYMYNQRSKMLLEITNLNNLVQEKEEELSLSKQNIEEIKKKLEEKAIALEENEKEIRKKTEEFKAVFASKEGLHKEISDCRDGLNFANANIYNLILKLGEGISNNDLAKIPYALDDLGGEDSDRDGLPDEFEIVIGTNPMVMDSDKDSYSDYDELSKGFNPNGEGKMSFDMEFAQKYVGKILLQVESEGQAWYVDKDGKRHFMGNPANAFAALRGMPYWTKNWMDVKRRNKMQEASSSSEIVNSVSSSSESSLMPVN